MMVLKAETILGKSLNTRMEQGYEQYLTLGSLCAESQDNP